MKFPNLNGCLFWNLADLVVGSTQHQVMLTEASSIWVLELLYNYKYRSRMEGPFAFMLSTSHYAIRCILVSIASMLWTLSTHSFKCLVIHLIPSFKPHIFLKPNILIFDLLCKENIVSSMGSDHFLTHHRTFFLEKVKLNLMPHHS